jgi:hypothetical protein
MEGKIIKKNENLNYKNNKYELGINEERGEKTKNEK